MHINLHIILQGGIMDQSCALFTAGIVFAIVAIIHILRLVYKFEVKIAGKIIPLWANWIGLVIAGALSVWMFTAM